VLIERERREALGYGETGDEGGGAGVVGKLLGGATVVDVQGHGDEATRRNLHMSSAK